MRERLIYPLMATAVTLLVHFLLHVAWTWAALIGFVAAPIAGTLITADDDLPGGFSNPLGTKRPDWLTLTYWQPLFGGIAVTAFVAAAESSGPSTNAAVFALIGVVAAALCAVLARRDKKADRDPQP